MSLIIGIAGSLLGVIIGAFLTRWIDATYERRREVRRTVASALILREELKDARAGFGAIADMKQLGPSFLFAGLEEWHEHRDLLLAAGMSHGDWSELARIFRRLLEIRESFRRVLSDADGERAELNDDLSAWVKGVADECAAAESQLDPFIVEGTVPLLRPYRIFKTP